MTRRTGNHQNHQHNNRTGSVGAGPGGSNSRQQNANQEEGEAKVPVSRKKPVGLVNLGNTCFMNSALQCLARTPNLIGRLEMLANDPILNFSGSALSYNDENCKNELQVKLVIPQDTMIRKLLHLLKQMTEGTMNGPVHPRAVQLAMAKNFGIGLQHDSHELLRTVLDKMKKEQIKAFRVALMHVFKVPITEASKVNQTDPQKALEMKEWDRKFYHTTCVDEIFGGELLHTRTCLECNTVKNSSEEFLDISLPILVVKPNSQQNNKTVYNNRFSMWNDGATKNRSLQECFQSFIEPEILSGNNSVDCEKCHELKLNQVRKGVPIEQVFPQPEPSTASTSTSTTNAPLQNKNLNTKFAKGSNQLQQSSQLQPQTQQPQQTRKKKRRKTRKDKIAEDLLVQEKSATDKIDVSSVETIGAEAQGDTGDKIGAVEEVDEEDSATSETDMPELEKISDEGYAEDYKDSDDSAGAASGPEQELADEQSSRSPDLDPLDPTEGSGEGQADHEDGSDQEDRPSSEAETLPPKPVFVIPKSTKSPCRRQTMISKPPQNLTIHLKRFTMSSKGFTCKIGDHVKFSEYIDIRDCVTTSFPSDDQSSQVSSSSWSFDELGSGSTSNKEESEMTEDTEIKSSDPMAAGDGEDSLRALAAPPPLPSSVIIALPPTPTTITPSASANSSSSTTVGNVGADVAEGISPAAKVITTVTASPPGNGDAQDFLLQEEGSSSSPDEDVTIPVAVTDVTPVPVQDTTGAAKLNESSADDAETESGFTLLQKPLVEPKLESKGDIIAAMASAAASSSASDSHNEDYKHFAGETFLVDETLSSNLDQVDIVEENEDDIVGDSNSNDNDIDDEPPPYPGSPILDDNEENDYRDNGRPSSHSTILPGDTGCGLWGYKTPQDIVEWTFKSEEAKEFGPEPLDLFPVGVVAHQSETTGNLDEINTADELESESSQPALNSAPIPLPPIASFYSGPHPSTITTTAESSSSSRLTLGLDLDLEGSSSKDVDLNPPNVIPLGYSCSNEEMGIKTNSGLSSWRCTQDNNGGLSWGGSGSGAGGDAGEALNSKGSEPFGGDVLDPNGIVYRLNGIVEHSGSLHWGHYVAYIRVNSDWFYISDSHVMPSDISTVLSQDPYILFYERVNNTNNNPLALNNSDLPIPIPKNPLQDTQSPCP